MALRLADVVEHLAAAGDCLPAAVQPQRRPAGQHVQERVGLAPRHEAQLQGDQRAVGPVLRGPGQLGDGRHHVGLGIHQADAHDARLLEPLPAGLHAFVAAHRLGGHQLAEGLLGGDVDAWQEVPVLGARLVGPDERLHRLDQGAAVVHQAGADLDLPAVVGELVLQVLNVDHLLLPRRTQRPQLLEDGVLHPPLLEALHLVLLGRRHAAQGLVGLNVAHHSRAGGAPQQERPRPGACHNEVAAQRLVFPHRAPAHPGLQAHEVRPRRDVAQERARPLRLQHLDVRPAGGGQDTGRHSVIRPGFAVPAHAAGAHGGIAQQQGVLLAVLHHPQVPIPQAQVLHRLEGCWRGPRPVGAGHRAGQAVGQGHQAGGDKDERPPLLRAALVRQRLVRVQGGREGVILALFGRKQAERPLEGRLLALRQGRRLVVVVLVRRLHRPVRRMLRPPGRNVGAQGADGGVRVDVQVELRVRVVPQGHHIDRHAPPAAPGGRHDAPRRGAQHVAGHQPGAGGVPVPGVLRRQVRRRSLQLQRRQRVRHRQGQRALQRVAVHHHRVVASGSVHVIQGDVERGQQRPGVHIHRRPVAAATLGHQLHAACGASPGAGAAPGRRVLGKGGR